MTDVTVLLPVGVTDDVMTPLRLLSLSATLQGQECGRCKVIINLSEARREQVLCTVTEQQIIPSAMPGRDRIICDLKNALMERLMSAINDNGMETACLEFSQPLLPALTTSMWLKLSPEVDIVPYVDPAASQAMCTSTI